MSAIVTVLVTPNHVTVSGSGSSAHADSFAIDQTECAASTQEVSYDLRLAGSIPAIRPGC